MSCDNREPIIITIEEPDVNLVMASFDSIQVWRSITGPTGAFQEVTDQNTRPRLVADKTVYTFTDANGAQGFYYKFRYYNSLTQAVDAFSTPERGAPDPALQVITIEELKELYLFGVDLTNDKGEPYPNALFAHYIKSAIDWLEKKIQVPILPRRYVEECHDYYREDYNKYIWLKLVNAPVIGVEECKLVLPGEQVVKVFERDWLHLQRFEGQLQMVPGTGTAGTILLGASGAWLPLIYGNNKFIPDAFRVTYEAGFGRPSNPNAVGRPDPELDSFPQNIKHCVGMIASLGPFNIAGDMIAGAGIASTSIGIDGLSQSVSTTASATNAGYGARIIQYQKDLKDMIPSLQRYYGKLGAKLTVV
jgi:hypothetical protein